MNSKISILNILFFSFCGVFFAYAFRDSFLLIYNENFSKETTIICILYLTIFLMFLYFIYKIKYKEKKIIVIALLLILMGVILRIFSIHYLKTIQVSDFANVEKLYKLISNGGFKYHVNTIDNNSLQNNFAMFPTWGLYSYLMVNFFNIFGFKPELIKILNLFLFSISSFIVFCGAKRMYNYKIALTTLLIMSMCPSLILYINIATPDHFTILFMSIIIFIWAILLKTERNSKKYIYLTILLILCMNLVNLFKPLSIYMLLVFIFSEILNTSESIKKYLKRYLKYDLFFIILFVFINFSFNAVMNSYISNNIKLSIKDSSSLYLLWGYSINNKNEYDSNYIYKDKMPELLAKYNNNYDLALADMKVIAKDNFRKNFKYIPIIWKAKFEILFCSEGDYFSFSNTGRNNVYISQKYFNDYIVLANSFMGINYIMICLTCFLTIKKNNHIKENSLLLLMIIGFLLITILGGAQGRYKSLVYPQLSIIYSVGIYYLYNLINYFNFKFKKEKGGVTFDISVRDNTRL